MFILNQNTILALRILVGLIFVWSGFSHVRDPEGRSKDLGLPKPIVLLVGIVELLAGLGIAGGLLTRLSAVGVMIVMLGAMHRKAFVWHSGFWGRARRAGTTICCSFSSPFSFSPRTAASGRSTGCCSVRRRQARTFSEGCDERQGSRPFPPRPIDGTLAPLLHRRSRLHHET